MSAYYNEHDRFAAQWLRHLIAAGLIADGEVDERSIIDVRPDDLRGFVQCHFFAGIGGWSAALRLAGWPDDRSVWTGSCPCQPWSVAGRARGETDPRDLWPVWFKLLRECRPAVVFGEQVAGADGRVWLDRVYDDLEADDYAIGAVHFSGACIGSPDIRPRLWFVAESGYGSGQSRERRSHCASEGSRQRNDRTTVQTGAPRDLADTDRAGFQGWRRDELSACADQRAPRTSGASGFWSDAEWIPCRDGRLRPVEPGTFPLAARLPLGLGRLSPEQQRLADLAGADGASLRRAKANRVGRLRGYGNAIIPQVAAAFIETYQQDRDERMRTTP